MMFFANPVAAMRNIRTALKPGGRLMFMTWRAIGDNAWAEVPKKLMLDFLPPPGEDGQSCGPGPFSMASPEVVAAQLKIGGIRGRSLRAHRRRHHGRRDGRHDRKAVAR